MSRENNKPQQQSEQHCIESIMDSYLDKKHSTKESKELAELDEFTDLHIDETDDMHADSDSE